MKWLCLPAVLWASLLQAQTSTVENFDDLAARAQAEVDSNPAEAVSLYRKALDIRPGWAEGWLYMGADLYQLQRFPEARDAFRKGVALAPQLGMAVGFLGLCEYEMGDLHQALVDIMKGESLGLGPNLVFETLVRRHAALILVREQAYDEALAQLGPLTVKKVNTPEVEEAIGLCALTMPRRPESLTPQERAVVDLAGRATWANMCRRSSEAEEAFRELMSKYADFPGVHYANGVYQMEMDQRLALSEFEKELKLHPAHWPSMLVIGFLRTRDGDPEGGIQMTQNATRLEPARDRWIALTAIGQAYLAMGETDKAIAALQEALQQQPNNDSIHFFLGQAFRQAGRKADALRERDEFVRLREQTDPRSMPTPPGMGAPQATETAP
jgi:tetratricopeptide (TPR) repeat protein